MTPGYINSSGSGESEVPRTAFLLEAQGEPGEKSWLVFQRMRLLASGSHLHFSAPGALLRVHSQQRTILSPPRALLQPPSPTLPSASSAEPVITPGLPESLG